MARIRDVKKYGNSYAIKLEPADLKDFTIAVGDKINIDEIIKADDVVLDPHEVAEDQLSGVLANKQRMKQ